MTDKKIDEVIKLNSEIIKLNQKYEELEKKYIKEGQSSAEHIKNLQSTVAEQSNVIGLVTGTIQISEKENKRLLEDSTRLLRELVDMTRTKNREIDILIENRDQERVRAEKAEQQVRELRERKKIPYKKWFQFWKKR